MVAGLMPQEFRMPTPAEYKTAQSRILAYPQKIGWTYVPAAATGRRCLRIRAVAVDIDGDALSVEVVAAPARPSEYLRACHYAGITGGGT
jgi:hypothetical protein